MTKVGELFIDVSADTSKFEKEIDKGIKKPLGDSEEKVKQFEKSAADAFNRAGDAAKGFGDKASKAGKNLSLKLTAPIVAIGGAAFKMSMDFETSMSKIVGLVGIAADEVEAWEGQVKELAGTYGKSAGEAADALFFITSAGLRGADATNTLEAALKASAVGLGDVTTIADLATSAMNAYGSAVLPASAATDVMVAAVREGKLEASELAGSMGKVLPIASAMGVRFDEVGATFAALSRTGTGASEAATQLRGILGALLKPTADAEKQLSELGLSSSDLRKQIGEQGLFSTLQTLTSAFGDNETAQARVFGNVRALAGVMDLMGANVETTEQIFNNMTTTTGDLDKAFEVTAETTGFKLQQAFAQTKIALMEFGDMIAPVVARVADAIKGLTDRFTAMDDSTKKIILIVAGFLALLGPGLLIVGKFASMFGVLFKTVGFTIAVVKAMTGATVASSAATKVATIVTKLWTGAVKLLNIAMKKNPIGLIITGVTLLIGLFVLVYKRFEKFRIVVNTVVNFVIGYFEFMVNAWIKAINFFVSGINKFTGIFRKVGIPIAELGEIGEVSFGRLSTATEQASKQAGGFAKEGGIAAESAEELSVAALLASLNLDGGNGSGGFSGSAGKATKATEKMSKEVKALRKEIGKGFESALKTAGDALNKAQDAFNSFGNSVSGAVTKLLSFGDAQKTSSDNSKTLTDALAKEADAQTKLNEAFLSGDSDAIIKAQKDLADATSAVVQAQAKPMTFFDSLNEQATKTKTFGELVNRLLAEGLSENALQQVLDAGVDAGTTIAQELLSSSENILAANNLVEQIANIGANVGTNAAGKFRQAGIDTAQALVDGINSVINNYTIKLKSKKLTERQLKKLKKQFSLDVEFVMGGNVPELANGAIVNQRTPAIIGEAGPEAVIPISRPARALQLMEQTGLANLARTGGSAVNIENATFVSPIDAELVAQKVLVAEKARSL